MLCDTVMNWKCLLLVQAFLYVLKGLKREITYLSLLNSYSWILLYLANCLCPFENCVCPKLLTSSEPQPFSPWDNAFFNYCNGFHMMYPALEVQKIICFQLNSKHMKDDCVWIMNQITKEDLNFKISPLHVCSTVLSFTLLFPQIWFICQYIEEVSFLGYSLFVFHHQKNAGLKHPASLIWSWSCLAMYKEADLLERSVDIQQINQVK